MSVVVTVVIPCYQHQALVGRAVASCQAQTRKDIEIIVIDDGSTPPVADAWSATDARVRVIRTPNQGLAAARNEGLARACGEFIKFLDADDELLPDCLTWQVGSLSGLRRMVSVIGTELTDGVNTRLVFPKFDDFFSSVFLLNISPIHAFLFRTSDAKSVNGFYVGERTRGGNEDYDFYLRLALAEIDAVTVHRIGIRYYQIPGSMSRNRQVMESVLGAVMGYAVEQVLVRVDDFSTRQLFAVLAGLITKAEQISSDVSALMTQAENITACLEKRHDLSGISELIHQWFARIDLIAKDTRWTAVLACLYRLQSCVAMSQTFTYRHELVSLSHPLAFRAIEADLALQTLTKLTTLFSSDDRLVLWGAGYWGIYWLRWMSALHRRVVAFVDSQATVGAVVEGVPVLPPRQLDHLEFERVVICSVQFYDDILSGLERMGMANRVVDLRQLMK